MIVYVAQRECGDYYCGCGGGHIVGVYASEEEAAHAAGSGTNEPHLKVGVDATVTAVQVGETRWREHPWRHDDQKQAWT
jgi:hypothetical protein